MSVTEGDIRELADSWRAEASEKKEGAVSHSDPLHAEGLILERCARELEEAVLGGNQQ